MVRRVAAATAHGCGRWHAAAVAGLYEPSWRSAARQPASQQAGVMAGSGVCAVVLGHVGDDALAKFGGGDLSGVWHVGGKVGGNAASANSAFHTLDDEISSLIPT